MSSSHSGTTREKLARRLNSLKSQCMRPLEASLDIIAIHWAYTSPGFCKSLTCGKMAWLSSILRGTQDHPVFGCYKHLRELQGNRVICGAPILAKVCLWLVVHWSALMLTSEAANATASPALII